MKRALVVMATVLLSAGVLLALGAIQPALARCHRPHHHKISLCAPHVAGHNSPGPGGSSPASAVWYQVKEFSNAIPWLADAQTAVTDQSGALRSHWGTPVVHWNTQASFKVYIGTKAQLKDHGVALERCDIGSICAWHTVSYAVVEYDASQPAFIQLLFSHEVMESLVDPNINRRNYQGDLIEVCDPVQKDRYMASNGITLSDFTYPSFWDRDGTAPFDYLGMLQSR